jgi:large subunit ribosomal protein L23
MKEPRSIVRRALITEKGSRMREKQNRYSFEVSPDANKIEIKAAIQTIFKVDVLDVHTIHVQGKLKRLGRTIGRRSSWKKAIVTLKEGQTIELFDQI